MTVDTAYTLSSNIYCSLLTFVSYSRSPQGQGKNLYGVHPYYLNLEEDGRANSVLFMNSNAMGDNTTTDHFSAKNK